MSAVAQATMSFLYPDRDINYAFVLPKFPQNPIGGTHLTPYFDTSRDMGVGPRDRDTVWRWDKLKEYFLRHHPRLASGKLDDFWKSLSDDLFEACRQIKVAAANDLSVTMYDLVPNYEVKMMVACSICGLAVPQRDKTTLVKHCLCKGKKKADRLDMNVPCLLSVCGRAARLRKWGKNEDNYNSIGDEGNASCTHIDLCVCALFSIMSLTCIDVLSFLICNV